MTKEVCPVCKGTGKALTKQRFNGVVDPQKPHKMEVCWMCNGTGEIIKQETTHPLIHKYWTSGKESTNAVESS